MNARDSVGAFASRADILASLHETTDPSPTRRAAEDFRRVLESNGPLEWLRGKLLSAGGGEVIFGPDLARQRPAWTLGAGVTGVASSLRRLIEELAVVKPGRKTARSLSDSAKAALGMDVPIAEVLDNTLGPAAQGASAASAEHVTR